MKKHIFFCVPVFFFYISQSCAENNEVIVRAGCMPKKAVNFCDLNVTNCLSASNLNVTGNGFFAGNLDVAGVVSAQFFSGIIGITGLIGCTGSTGSAGQTGPTGFTGNIGSTGSTGSIGSIGKQFLVSLLPADTLKFQIASSVNTVSLTPNVGQGTVRPSFTTTITRVN